MGFVVKKRSKAEFYDIFSGWLDLHHFPRINDLVLPEFCFVAYVDDLPIYSCWFYFTNSKLAWLAFPASNKNISFKKREGGLEFLFEHISRYAKKKGIITLFTTSGTDEIIKPLLKNGFEIGDVGVSHFIKKL